MDELRPPVTRPRTARGARRTGASLALVLAGSLAVCASLASRSRPAPLANTQPSVEALAQAVLEAVRAANPSGLKALALTEDEFRTHVWPFLPISRPERNVPFEFAWGMLHRNSSGHRAQTADRFRDHRFTLERVELSGLSTRYGGVVVHRDTRLIVRTADGSRRTVRLFGSTIEQHGRYKVFSFVVDD